MKKLFNSLPFRLLLGILVGILLGQFFPESAMKVVVTLQYIMGQLITFCVPLIIIGFIAPSITKLGSNASRLLGVAVVIAYVSSICAAFMSTAAGYVLIPHLSIDTEVAGLRELPGVVFELNIPQIMSVMSALVLSVLVPGRSVLEVLLDQNLFWLLYLAFLCLLGVVMLRRLWYLRRMRRELAAGMVPDPGSWRRDRRWQQAVIVLLVVCWLLWLFSGAAPLWQGEPDTASLPYTSPMSLAEGTDKDDWEFEIKNYVYRRTPLAPDRFGVQYRGENGEVVRNAADRLRFGLLAQALYRERERTFRKDYPGAVETAVENDAFDRAVVLTAGEERLFLAQAGKVVYALWLNFPADLERAIEAVAADLAE